MRAMLLVLVLQGCVVQADCSGGCVGSVEAPARAASGPAVRVLR